MIKIIFYLVIFGNCITSLFQPWIGVVLAYLIIILTPQNIWWWAFVDLRALYWVSTPTLIGFLLAIILGRIEIKNWRSKSNFFVAILWLSCVVSFLFGPYVDVQNEYRFFDSSMVFSTLNKTFLMYFVAISLIDNKTKLKWFSLVLVITILYMIYWANSQYLNGYWEGRLNGPQGIDGMGIYGDQNSFAMLFVVGLPFLYYTGHFIDNKWLKLIIWGFIPFGWHAIFLTGSRGGIIGILSTLLVVVIRSSKKKLALLFIPFFFFFYTQQAGEIMKSRMDTVSEYQTETSAATRLEAWDAAIKMVESYPITGVGVGSMGQAFPDFSDKKPRIAHNTFFQISAEWGLLAGITYLLILIHAIRYLWRIGNETITTIKTNGKFLYYLSEACLCSIIGFYTCSMTLSLEGFEVFYYLLILIDKVILLTNSRKE